MAERAFSALCCSTGAASARSGDVELTTRAAAVSEEAKRRIFLREGYEEVCDEEVYDECGAEWMALALKAAGDDDFHTVQRWWAVDRAACRAERDVVDRLAMDSRRCGRQKRQ